MEFTNDMENENENENENQKTEKSGDRNEEEISQHTSNY